jgi:hypothetical protein
VPAPRPTVEADQLALLAGLAVVGVLAAPARLVHRGPMVCVVRRLTGLPCPTCGLTRSWHAAARLQLGTSLALHPLGPLTFALASGMALDDGALARRLPARGIAALLSAAWITVWLVRLRVAYARRASG